MSIWHEPGAFIERPINVAPEALGQSMVARSRIAVARRVLETPDAQWDRVREDVRGLLAPPEEET
jgi:hypothetical protein